MAADPKRSEGARLERAAMRRYLRRVRLTQPEGTVSRRVLDIALEWVLTRSARYDKRPGGLGRR